jgi:hypothetical protein
MVSLPQQYDRWRVSKGVTRMLGPRFRRSREVIQIDITYACDLRCFHCNRSCAQAPTEERISLERVRAFTQESAGRGLRWKQIWISGGEPTLHPELLEICDVLAAWRREHSPETRLTMVTNGRSSLRPQGISVRNSGKTERFQPHFLPFNLAPCDEPQFSRSDFRNGCKILSVAGIALTPRGYYPCAVAGGIDRVFGFGLERAAIPDEGDEMRAELERLCALCGQFHRNGNAPAVEPREMLSPSWARAYSAVTPSRP